MTPYRFLWKRFVEAALQAASTKRFHKNRYGVILAYLPLTFFFDLLVGFPRVELDIDL